MKRPNQRHLHPINEYIHAHTVRVIFEEINSEMPLRKALELAYDAELDLVQMNTGPIPTCKVMDYSKFLFELKKKQKQQNISNKTNIKELFLRPFISQNDLQIKAKQIESFLEKGCEVRIKMKLNNREKANAGEYHTFLTKFTNQFEILAKIQPGDKGIVLLKPVKKD